MHLTALPPLPIRLDLDDLLAELQAVGPDDKPMDLSGFGFSFLVDRLRGLAPVLADRLEALAADVAASHGPDPASVTAWGPTPDVAAVRDAFAYALLGDGGRIARYGVRLDDDGATDLECSADLALVYHAARMTRDLAGHEGAWERYARMAVAAIMADLRSTR